MVTVNNSGGFEYQFVSSPADIFVCKICHLPSRDPHLTVCCGHVFCKSCLDCMKEAKSIVTNTICPVCRSEDFVTFPNKQIDREVKNLHVYCTNKGRGCKWQGEVNYIDNHLAKDEGCEYEDVACTSGCGEMIQRQDLTKHVETECSCRMVDCHYCKLTGEHQFIEGKHKEECAEYPIPCPNKCEDECIPRKDMNKHRSICSLEEINCEYQTMGCEMKMTRQTQKEHNKEKMEYHLHLTKCKLDETSCELGNTKSKLNDVTFKLDKATSKLDETTARLHETTARLHETSCQLNTTVSRLDKTNFDLREASYKLDRAHSQLDLLKGSQLELSNTKFKLDFLQTTFDAKINSIEALLREHEWSSQLYSVAQVSSPGKEVIPVTFKMTGFTKKKKAKKEWHSESFYTNIKGYRMCLQVDADGDGQGTHCAMFLYLMRGEFDDGAHWPLNMKLKVTLLNQKSDDQHHSHIIRFSNAVHMADVTHRVVHGDKAASGWGRSTFISNEDLTEETPTRRFLKNDCIFVSVSKP